MTYLLILAVICGNPVVDSYDRSGSWGFYSHELINRSAIFTLPDPLFGYYKKNMHYIEQNATKADKRRYAVSWEGPRHFLDFEAYPDSILGAMPLPFDTVLSYFDSAHFDKAGLLPWHVATLKHQLTRAFREKDHVKILKYSVDAGHYLGDANVPLHTTENYNGQLTAQEGIHGFWESRLPELFASSYNLITGKARYCATLEKELWKHMLWAHQAVDSVLRFERVLNEGYRPDLKFSHEKRKNTTIRTYSRSYSSDYHVLLNGMVERQMRRSIQLIGVFWYSCWVDAGMPDLN